MSDFAFLYRGRDTTAPPEQMQRHLEKWRAWFKDLTAKGYIRNPGFPLEDAGQVVRGKSKSVHDGPFAEAKDVVAGVTLVEARNLAEATELSQGCPILEVGGSVEIRPLRNLNM